MILAGGGDTDYNYTIFVKKDSVVDNFFFSICYISSVVVLKRNCFRSKSNAATEYDFFLLFFFYFANLQPPTEGLSENSETTLRLMNPVDNEKAKRAGKHFKMNIYKL